MRELADSVAAQLVVECPEEMLGITSSIGASCIEGCAIFTELANGTRLPHLRQAARSIGAYGQILDHATEVDDDLADGSNTFATLVIREEGDSPTVRRKINERYMQVASDVFNEGKAGLSKKQVKRYTTLRRLIDLKFKVINRIKK